MKTTLTKIALLGIAGAIAFALSSFKNEVSTTKVNKKSVVEDEYAEWNKVRAFVDLNITTAIKQKTNVKIKSNSFSRCPSGYQPDFLADYEDVKTDREVLGSLELYRGCAPEHICDFKVCVNKKIALVKSKDSNEYITVKEWLAKKDIAPSNNSTVKNTKTVKG
jgi:hypothetical protein